MLMKKSLFFAALVGVALASCTSEEYLGADGQELANSAEGMICFGGGSNHYTRANATGAAAAAMLGNQFKVLGKNVKNGVASDVFNNYIVNYNGNAGDPADETNKFGWTYLGVGTQQVKYWDFSASRYEFVAFSGMPDPTQRIASTEANTLAGITATTVQNVFAADRVQATYVGGTPESGIIKYMDDVRFNFKRLASRVRFGLYETIPGYAVTNVVFYYGDNALSAKYSDAVATAGLRGQFPTNADYNITYDAKNAVVANLEPGADFSNNFVFGALDYTTAKAANGTDNLKVDGTADATGDAAFLGTNSAEVTWAKQDAVIDGQTVTNSAWQTVLPSQANATNLVLRVNFDLVPLDGGPTVRIYNASAVVPSQWCQWKPNYAYTYVFKISDAISGQTTPPGGVDPDKDTDGDGIPDIDDPDDDNDGIPDVDDPDDDGDGIPDEDDPYIPNVPDPDTENPDDTPDPALTPIVFDAVVSSIEDDKQETITGITSLGGNAITTYSPESNITDAAEYKVGETIQLSSYSHGQWKVVYTDLETTEKAVADNNTFTYTTLTEVESGKTIDQSATCGHSAEFKAEQAGWYIVWFRYLPYTYSGTANDVDSNYIDVFKVIKIHD